ncbi:hypothetical protein [Limosilactobacillus sp.]|uniref:hypothetical protein n=1 Tax=Limosilactobacillus sp. TaxID=2773925 RepID=UPI00345E32C1
MISLLVALAVIWLLWKLLKLSIVILFWLIVIALAAFFVKALIIPAIVLIGGIFVYGLNNY